MYEALGVSKSGGRCCEQDYFGLSGLWTAERAGVGQKQLRGTSRAQQDREGDRGTWGKLEQQPIWPVKVRPWGIG